MIQQNTTSSGNSTSDYLKDLYFCSFNGGTLNSSVEEVVENLAINKYGRSREEAKAHAKAIINLRDAVNILIERMSNDIDNNVEKKQ